VEKSLTPDEKAEKIIAAISQAFGKVLRGQGISLHEADALDSYASADRVEQARLLDTDIHWWEIAPEQLERFNGVLIYTNAEGFRYYIPAYMTVALRTWQSGSLAVEAAVSSLFPLTPNASERYALLDEKQKKCVARFLWFMATETDDRWTDKLKVYNATRALEELWYPYLEGCEVL
jgi:hypothetical protein